MSDGPAIYLRKLTLTNRHPHWKTPTCPREGSQSSPARPDCSARASG